MQLLRKGLFLHDPDEVKCTTSAVIQSLTAHRDRTKEKQEFWKKQTENKPRQNSNQQTKNKLNQNPCLPLTRKLRDIEALPYNDL